MFTGIFVKILSIVLLLAVGIVLILGIKLNVEVKETKLSNSLFSISNTKELSLIESHRKVDFFIKQNCCWYST